MSNFSLRLITKTGIGGGVKLKVSFLMVTGRCQIRTGLTPSKKIGYRVGGYFKGLGFRIFLFETN